MTAWSVPPIIPADTTDGVTGPCGAMLGRYIQPKPSLLMSNSTNDGVMAAPWRRTSRGVVIDTRHFTRVSNTGPPLNDAVGLPASPSVAAGFRPTAARASAEDGEMSVFDRDDDDDDAGCSLSIVAANVRPVNVSASRLASCDSSLSAAQNRGVPRRRKSLTTATQMTPSTDSHHIVTHSTQNRGVPRCRKSLTTTTHHMINRQWSHRHTLHTVTLPPSTFKPQTTFLYHNNNNGK